MRRAVVGGLRRPELAAVRRMAVRQRGCCARCVASALANPGSCDSWASSGISSRWLRPETLSMASMWSMAVA